MQALAEEWKKRDREREALVKKKVRKYSYTCWKSHYKSHIARKLDKLFHNYHKEQRVYD